MELINDIYKDALGIELKLKNEKGQFLKASDIVKTNESKNIELINENFISNNLYGTWEASRKVTDSTRYYIWGTAYEEIGDQNAKTILKGNLNIVDIILIENEGQEKAYIFLENKIIGANEIIYETKNVSEKYDAEDAINKFLADLVSKDSFVILSPATFMKLTDTQLDNSNNLENLNNLNNLENSKINKTIMVLPNTGKSKKLVFICMNILIVAIVLLYIKFKEYKDIK